MTAYSRSTTVWRRTLIATTCSLALANCASGSPTLEEANPARAAQVHQVCRNIMGYTPIEVEYRACVDSLMQTLAGSDTASAVQQDRMTCAQKGYQRGTAQFANCVVDHDQPLSQNQ